MKKINKMVWVLLAAVAVFLFVEFLPSIAGVISDHKYVNKDTVVKKDKDDGIQFDLSLQDKLSILASFETVPIEIISTTSVDELSDYDENLLYGLQKQIFYMQNSNMIPMLNCTMPELKENFVKASYYNISNQYSSVIGVPVWLLEFKTDTDCVYRFVVDATTKDIYVYSLKVPQEDMQLFWDSCMLEPRMRETTDEYIYMENMLNKMAEYYDAYNGYISYSNSYDLDFTCVLNYTGDFEDTSITFSYSATDFDISRQYVDISMGVHNLMRMVPVQE